MSYLKERVSYLKGLAEGMQINETTNEGKLLKAIIDVMEDVALSVEDIEEIQDELSMQVDTIDEDLGEIEKIILGDDGCGCGCGDHDDECDDDEDEDGGSVLIQCPHCKEEVELNLDDIDDENSTVKCPVCDKEIEIEWDCSCDDCSDDE